MSVAHYAVEVHRLKEVRPFDDVGRKQPPTDSPLPQTRHLLKRDIFAPTTNAVLGPIAIVAQSSGRACRVVEFYVYDFGEFGLALAARTTGMKIMCSPVRKVV